MSGRWTRFSKSSRRSPSFPTRSSISPRRFCAGTAWAQDSTRAPAIRVKIAGALERYRAALRAVAVEALGADGAAPAGVTPDGFAAVAVSLIDGCALQAVIAPQSFDLSAYLETVQGIIEQLGAPAPQGAASASGAGSVASAPR